MDEKKFNLEDNMLSDDDLDNVSGGADNSFTCPNGLAITGKRTKKCIDCAETECPVRTGDIW